MIVDYSGMPLGRSPAKPKELSKRVSLVEIVPDMPEPAQTYDGTKGVRTRPTWGNNTIGDCTACQIANSLSDVMKVVYDTTIQIPVARVLTLYKSTSGDPTAIPPVPPWNPNAPLLNGVNPTDTGAVYENVTSFVLKNKFDGHTLIASAGINPGSAINIKRGIQFLGTCGFGWGLPLAWQTMSEWSLVGYNAADPKWQFGSWGGHETDCCYYDQTGIWVWTWGGLIRVTWDAVAIFCDEVDALLWASWIRANKGPAGVSLANLENYMSELRAAA